VQGRLEYWHDAILIAAMIGRGRLRRLVRAMIDLVLTHQIVGFGKTRHPTTRLKLRVPANMIGVQVRAHYNIDIFGRTSARRKVGEIACLAAQIPFRPQ